MSKKKTKLHFIDDKGKSGLCMVTPSKRFNYKIDRKTAEELLNKHGHNLPFDIMTPSFDADDGDDWMGYTIDDMEDGKIDTNRKKFEIWLNQ